MSRKPKSPKVQAAVDRVGQPRPPEAKPLRQIQLVAHAGAVNMRGRQLELDAPDREGVATLFIQDGPGLPWRALALPPGTTWLISEKPVGPDLWLPSGTPARRP